MKSVRFKWCLSLFILAVAGVAGAARGGEHSLVVSAAASLRDVLVPVARQFEARHPGVSVDLNFGASSLLARQAWMGAPVDVFLSADARTMDRLEKDGSIRPGSRVDLFRNRVVALVPEESDLRVEEADDLASSSIRRVALCDDPVPVGGYARAFLKKRGLLRRLEGRIVRVDDVKAAAAAVDGGNADLGFVYATDARLARHSRVVFTLAEEDTGPIVYPGAILAQSLHDVQAQLFLDFLKSPLARTAFTDAGFIVIP